MQVKVNERGVYLFFPSNDVQLEKSVDEAHKLTEQINELAAWDIYKVVWTAFAELQNRLYDLKIQRAAMSKLQNGG